MNHLKSVNVLMVLIFTKKYVTNVLMIILLKTITTFSAPLIPSSTESLTNVTVKMGLCSEIMAFVYPNAKKHKIMVNFQYYVRV
jgi:hypothetical protein